MTRISRRAQKRITESVLWTERASRGAAKNPGWGQRQISPVPMLVVAQEDIAANAAGTCRIVEGTFSSGASASAADNVECYNIGAAITTGTKVLAHWASFRWSSASPIDGTWLISMGGGSTTPPTTQAANVFWDEDYYHYGGTDDGTQETTTPGELKTPDNEAFFLRFNQQVGPNIGITLSAADETHFQFTAAGTYKIDFTSIVRPWRIYSVSNPTDRSIMYQVIAHTTSNQINGNASLTNIATATASSDFGAYTNQDSGVEEYGPNMIFNVTGWHLVKFAGGFGTAGIEVNFWTEYSDGYTSVSDYGWRMIYPQVVITQIA